MMRKIKRNVTTQIIFMQKPKVMEVIGVIRMKRLCMGLSHPYFEANDL